jgi:sugar transferase (PEP-CTERM/EpsH1 system associated)
MRVLFLTHRLPYAPNRGDRIRAFHILHQLRRSADVDLVSLVHDSEEESHAEALRTIATVTTARVPRRRNLARAVTALPTSTPLTHVLLDSPEIPGVLRRIVAERRPDVVLAYCSGMARFALLPPLADIPFVLDMVDLDSVKWTEMARTARPPKRWIYGREARLLERFEANAIRRARSTLVVNDRECDAVARLAPGARIHVVGNGIDVSGLRSPTTPAGYPIVVFCGVMNYAPNEEGARWLAREVWPTVRTQRPAARLVLAGANPTAAVRALASADSTVTVTGTVDDIRPHLWRAAVAAAPLFMARGIQNKVVEAIAAGLPCVVTTAVREGLPDQIMRACVVEDDAARFAGALIALLDESPADRRAVVERADLHALEWSTQLAPLQGILRDAIGAGT